MCETIMEAVSLTKHFRSADKTWFTAVDGASISLQKGKTLGLLGQSGSGKSTLGQMMVGLLKPDSGELFFHGKLLSYPIRGQARRRIQILFQHPEVSFNPQLTLRQSLVEPFKLMGKPFDDGAILSVIELFGLHAEHLARYPGELSGGELQRAALARVTVLEPEMILLDEPTSFLDIRYKLELLTILKKLVREQNVAVVLSLHELDLAQKISDRVVCVKNGEITCIGTPEEVFANGSVRELYGLTAGSYDERFGSLELEPVRGEPLSAAAEAASRSTAPFSVRPSPLPQACCTRATWTSPWPRRSRARSCPSSRISR